ncbi:hypothetical protein Y032_0006g3124 [Ancylostoma ceylanicum]|uniref:7TM GPCR serpentine receptor class x (Srx) domain-containing protein n=1 Tax=Ancylostoma ceylanicum TaxID=53326 RepID=A0A016VRL8_9BILA|nr:hypothetical protein Y032_0006g3124 [Ancylostoma ceylanicum]
MNHCLSSLSYHGFVRENSTRWEHLVGTSFIFQFTYIIDTIIMITFHESFRRLFCQSLCRKTKWIASYVVKSVGE